MKSTIGFSASITSLSAEKEKDVCANILLQKMCLCVRAQCTTGLDTVYI